MVGGWGGIVIFEGFELVNVFWFFVVFFDWCCWIVGKDEFFLVIIYWK